MKKTGFTVMLILFLISFSGSLSAQERQGFFNASEPGIVITNKPQNVIDLQLHDDEKTFYIRGVEVQNSIDAKYVRALSGTQKETGKRLILIFKHGEIGIEEFLFVKEKDDKQFRLYYADKSMWRAGEDFDKESFLYEFFSNFTIDIDFPGGSADKLAAHIQSQSIKAFKPFSPILSEALQLRVSGIEVEADMPDNLTFPAFKVKKVIVDWIGDALAPMMVPLLRDRINSSIDVDINLIQGKNVQQKKSYVLNVKIELPLNAFPETETYIFKFRNTEFEYTQVVSALEQAWFLKGYAVTAQVHFHETTRLFMITGTGSELNTARQVLEQLNSEPEKDEKEDDESDDELLRHVKEQNELLTRKYDELINAITQLKKAVDALYVK